MNESHRHCMSMRLSRESPACHTCCISAQCMEAAGHSLLQCEERTCAQDVVAVGEHVLYVGQVSLHGVGRVRGAGLQR